MKQIQQDKYNRKAWQYQQLALPIAQNIEIAEDEPVFVANAQLEELDYRELYKAYSPIGRKSAAEPRIMFKLLIAEYYAIAPDIVRAMQASNKFGLYCKKLWLEYIEPCLDMIHKGAFESCKRHYIKMVRYVQAEFSPNMAKTE